MNKEDLIKLLKKECIGSAIYGGVAGLMIAFAFLWWGRDSSIIASFYSVYFIYLFIKDLRSTIKKIKTNE